MHLGGFVVHVVLLSRMLQQPYSRPCSAFMHPLVQKLGTKVHQLRTVHRQSDRDFVEVGQQHAPIQRSLTVPQW